VDWFLCSVIAAGFMHYRLGESGPGSFKPLGVFILMNLLLVGTLGSTIGHRLLGIRVFRIDGSNCGLIPTVIRTLLLALLIPALFWDRDSRGFHDKIAGTVAVRI
jgi:uncharacterized RDD family membrane protein YckC